ncbi:AAA-like domain-containing protein [Anaerolineales bacterium HSG24]|nr:AAA-like domain-containing protein [Anaerolineales bacterium HSG24]
MRTFSSYEEVNTNVNYYVPREKLIEQGYNQLLGDEPSYGGHYMTVWAPRQTGKSWVMRQVVSRIRKHGDFEVAIVTLQSTKTAKNEQDVLDVFIKKLRNGFDRDFPELTSWKELDSLFTATYFDKPVILILDEFDSMGEAYINNFANEFRNMYSDRINDLGKLSGEKGCLLHGLALVGVRAVLGIESRSGSPFNVQRSLHIPNLTFAEVNSMYKWYERESGQTVEDRVIEQIYYVTRGQPGLVSWFGELLTKEYKPGPDQPPLDWETWEWAWNSARYLEPNNTVMNLIAKARTLEYQGDLLQLFAQSDIPFSFHNPTHNYLYMNGIIVPETIRQTNGKIISICRFSSPFIQDCIYDALGDDLVSDSRILDLEPMDDLADVFDPAKKNIDLPALLQRYKDYLVRLKAAGYNPWKEQPRRETDFHLSEAVGHFHLYSWLQSAARRCIISPEFPTGNGKVDLHLRYEQKQGVIEVKSFVDNYQLGQDKGKASTYAKNLGLDNITMAVFVPVLDEKVLAKLSGVDMINGIEVTVVTIGWV